MPTESGTRSPQGRHEGVTVTDIRKGLVGVVADETAISKVNPETNSLL